MKRQSKQFRRFCLVMSIFISPMVFVFQAKANITLQGQVVNTNGLPVAQAQVIFDRDEEKLGASVVTVFTDINGSFSFPGIYPEQASELSGLSVRALGYEQVEGIARPGADANSSDDINITFVLKKVENQVEVAPASAWLERITDRRQKSKFVMDCIDCHQVPASEVRNFAGSIADIHAADPVLARSQSWNYIVKYMNYLSNWEFSRGSRNEDDQIDADAVYSVDNGEDVAALLTTIFDDRLDSISGYAWGAPLITTADTVIWEYEITQPNAIREAVLMNDSTELWVADVSSNNMYSIDIATGKNEVHNVPSDGILMSPHSLHAGQDDTLWITPLFNGIVAHVDPKTQEWETWTLKTDDGRSPGIHDLSFGYEHKLLTDVNGRIWFSDIGNNSVGYFDPRGNGKSEIWTAPPSPGRSGATSLYGLVMTSDQNEVWYSQLANGTFGGFDIAKQEYIGPFQLPDVNAGPRRVSISDDDVMYLALYGSGQLAEFDTKTRKMVGIYDLPDTGSAPYSATWDTVRKVVWIPTSNGDVIYKFDPVTKEFGVLPLPREQAFMRMVNVDPKTGVLVSSYANIVDIVHGPRMAFIIDPGDGAYPEKFSLASEMTMAKD